MTGRWRLRKLKLERDVPKFRRLHNNENSGRASTAAATPLTLLVQAGRAESVGSAHHRQRTLQKLQVIPLVLPGSAERALRHPKP